MKLDEPKLSDTVAKAMLSGEKQELPMILAPKKVPDEQLEKVTDVVASYATNFNNGQRARSANIRLAADMINGIVLLPGQSFSFNRHVGRRTAEGGFRVAGVFVNGRKEEDIGGGICQVSTTLYNAAVLSDLKIVTRSNHSRPVPYVPIGRDAAVSYPNPDLVIENNQDIPIALAANVTRGRIEFSVLGVKTPGRTIRIAQGRVTSSPNGVKFMQDDTLGYGASRVIEGGADRKRIQTFKVVMQNGQEVSRENLHFSYYAGTPRIIARNSKARPAAPAAQPAGTAAGTAPAPTAPKAEPAPTSASPSQPVSPAPGD
jgi:vancomycin resistance protein YoaR